MARRMEARRAERSVFVPRLGFRRSIFESSKLSRDKWLSPKIGIHLVEPILWTAGSVRCAEADTAPSVNSDGGSPVCPHVAQQAPFLLGSRVI